MIVDPRVALSMVAPEPISTWSSIITFPICGTAWYAPFSSGTKPKPSAPIIAPECILQFFPIRESEYIFTPEKRVQSLPIIVLSPIILIGTYVFRAIYNYCVKLIIKLIEFSTSKNGILVLFIGVVLSYIVMDGILIEILDVIF